MALLHLEDYLDTVEALPIELSRNFTLMRELDSRAQCAVETIETQTAHFMENLRTLSSEEKEETLRKIAAAFKETLKHGEDKVALAVQTYDTVDRHVRRLDDDLDKFEEDQSRPRGIGSRDGGSRNRPSDKSGVSRGEKRAAADTPKKNKKMKFTDERDGSRDSPDTPRRGGHISRSGGMSSSKKSVASNGKKNDKKAEKPVIKGSAGLDMPIDPNEPTYCICHQVSFGDMIAVSIAK
ncbi:Inhibitor of growth protein 4 [Gaertneriomyces sp. JEL0708]|nr:Inhibitor of growth protein 4 [Gaertneriomyces sp. JEL0708]